MKKSFLILKLLSVIFAAGIFYSCDSGGGGGGGGSSGGGNSTGSADVKITIPKSTSSDINILGDFQLSDTDNFYYEIYYSKPNGSSESEHKYTNAGADEPVTFSNVKYDTYNFFLKIWVDSSKLTVLNTIQKEVAVSAQNNTVVFPDRSVSEYKNWFFVSTADDLSQAVTTISSDTTYSESNKAIICLTADIEMSDYQSVLDTISEKYDLETNGYNIAEKLFAVNIDTSIVGGTVTPSIESAPEGTSVTLTVNKEAGYRLASVSAAKSDGTTVGLTSVSEGTYSFTMPQSDVTVKAVLYDAIYVDGTSGSSETDGFTDSTALNTISAALEKISEIDNGDWTIKVIGALTTTGVTLQSISATSLTIEGVSSGAISGNNSNRVICIRTGVPVTLKNLTIKDGFCDDNKGGGILITGTAANVTLDGCVVKDNSVKNAGGAGICVSYDGGATAGTTLTLKDTSVTNNTITHDDTIISFLGAGVNIENVNMTLNVIGNSDISSNKIDCSSRTGGIAEEPQGAGFSLGNSATTTIEENVTVNGNTFILSSATGATSYGGGIYITGGRLTVAEINNFTGNTATSGNKIYFGGSVTYNGTSRSSGSLIN